jgi:hypothetical protein
MLAGHKRYAHIAALRGDGVLPELLDMDRVVSEDAVRRAFKRLRKRRARNGFGVISTIAWSRFWPSLGFSTSIRR